MLKKILKIIERKNKPVNLIDFDRVNPISSKFGLERGTPIDRYYIENFLKQNSQYIRGTVLEVGGTTYARKFGSDHVKSVESLNAEKETGMDLIGDLTNKESLPPGTIDCFICVQTLNFIFEVQKAVEGIHYLLKPEGIVLATVSGISQISRYDMERWGDFWRFTSASLERLFSRYFGKNAEIKSYGNVLAATAFLNGVSLEEIPKIPLLDEIDPDYQVILTIRARKES